MFEIAKERELSMEKMRIGDVIKVRKDSSDMIWEWNRVLKVNVNEEFDPIRAVTVTGCKDLDCEVTVTEPKTTKKKGAKKNV